jgi:hypothetical protein
MSQSQCLKKNNSIYCHINIFKKLISSNIYYILNLLLTVLLKKKTCYQYLDSFLC